MKKNDIVKVVDIKQVYFCYSKFIKRHLQYAIRWVYKGFPNVSNCFKIRDVYKHCMKDKRDVNSKCIVIQDMETSQIYLIGETGIKELNNNG